MNTSTFWIRPYNEIVVTFQNIPRSWFCSSSTILLLKKCQDKLKAFQGIGLTGMRLENVTSQAIYNSFLQIYSEYNPEAGDCKQLQFNATRKGKFRCITKISSLNWFKLRSFSSLIIEKFLFPLHLSLGPGFPCDIHGLAK